MKSKEMHAVESDFIHYPVNILNENLLKFFLSKFHEQDLKMDIDGGLNPHFKLVYSDLPIKDVAEIKPNKQIVLYSNFCQFYWCLCYSVLVIYDQGIVQPGVNGTYDGKLDTSNPLIRDALDVFSTGVSLFSECDDTKSRHILFERLPNPHSNPNHYTRKADGIYLAGMSFVLMHEYSHFYSDHLDTDVPTREQEVEADSVATFFMLNDVYDEEIKTNTIGIILATCSLMFVDDTMRGNDVYPDPDERIKNVLNEIKKHIDEIDEHHWAVICLCFKLWAVFYKKIQDLSSPEGVDTWEEYFEMICNVLYKIKKS